jgi:hypothetical protein
MNPAYADLLPRQKCAEITAMEVHIYHRQQLSASQSTHSQMSILQIIFDMCKEGEENLFCKFHTLETKAHTEHITRGLYSLGVKIN